MTTTETVGALVHVNPNDLIFDGNVRAVAGIDKAFIASIAEHGVLVPITAVRKDDSLVVRTGHRRTQAAQQAGVESVPVYVLPVAYADAKAETIDRVVTQIAENDHRAALDEVDRVRGIQQMLDAGMSITKAAKSLAVPQSVVKAAKTAAANPASMAVLGGGQASLEEAAAIAEFGDDEKAISRLINAAGTQRFAHQVAQLRQERATAAAAAQAAASWAEKGFTVLTERPNWRDPQFASLHRLSTADGGSVTYDAIRDRPAHWAVRMVEQMGYVDKDTGKPVDEDQIDWDVEDDDDATPEEGYVHPKTVTEQAVFEPEYYCIDVAGAGLVFDDPDEQSRQNASTDPEAAAKAQADREEQETRERRKVLALNKLGVAAQTVRREWVKALLSRKTPPKGAAAFVAATLASDAYLLTTNHARSTAAELLGLQQGDDGYRSIDGIGSAAAAEGLTEQRAQVLTLGLVLGALEARTGKDAWHGGGVYGYTGHDSPGEYLRFLASCGYELSDVEQVITKTKTADQVHDEISAP